MVRVPKKARGNIFLARGIHCCLSSLNLFCPTKVSILWICVYTHLTLYRMYIHTWLYRECIWITVANKLYCGWNIFTQIANSALLTDVYHWGAGLVISGRIHDTGQTFCNLVSNKSSSSPSFFQIFFLIYFTEEASIRNIIILCIKYIIIISVSNNNNNAINNNLCRTPRPYFALQNSPGHAKRFLQS